MKYRNWKIQTKHWIIKEFKSFLINIKKIVEIDRIIPWRISRQQKWTSKMFITFSYYTKAWLKYILKKWWTAQELFIICKKEKQEKVNKKIEIKILNLN
jgi:hypothetical protein